jgi:hypothetical protein
LSPFSIKELVDELAASFSTSTAFNLLVFSLYINVELSKDQFEAQAS